MARFMSTASPVSVAPAAGRLMADSLGAAGAATNTSAHRAPIPRASSSGGHARAHDELVVDVRDSRRAGRRLQRRDAVLGGADGAGECDVVVADVDGDAVGADDRVEADRVGDRVRRCRRRKGRAGRAGRCGRARRRRPAARPARRGRGGSGGRRARSASRVSPSRVDVDAGRGSFVVRDQRGQDRRFGVGVRAAVDAEPAVGAACRRRFDAGHARVRCAGPRPAGSGSATVPRRITESPIASTAISSAWTRRLSASAAMTARSSVWLDMSISFQVAVAMVWRVAAPATRRATRTPKRKPPTCAKNATPPPSAPAQKGRSCASTNW